VVDVAGGADHQGLGDVHPGPFTIGSDGRS